MFSIWPGQDPFTLVHSAIWAAFAAYVPWSNLVRPGARINDVPLTTINMKPMTLNPGDAPSVRLMQFQFKIDPGSGNSGSMLWSQSFRLELDTTYQNVIPINQLKFYSIIALAQQPDNLGVDFLEDWYLTDGSDSSMGAGVRQWGAAIGIHTKMRISRQILQNL